MLTRNRRRSSAAITQIAIWCGLLACMLIPGGAAWAQPVQQTTGVSGQTMTLECPRGAAAGLSYGVTIELQGQPIPQLLNGVSAMRFGWLRQPVRQVDVEPQPGVVDWMELDAVVEQACLREMRLLLAVEGAPADVVGLAQTLAARYTGRVAAYQIGPSPDNAGVWGLPAADYVALLRDVYEVIKAADPGALVVTAGFDPAAGADQLGDSEAFLERFFAAGGAAWHDVLGVRVPTGAPVADTVAAAQQIAGAYGQHPIWLTQVGASYGGPSDPDGQAVYLLGALAEADREPAVRALFVDNFNLAVVHPADAAARQSLMDSDWTARPALIQLAQLRQEQVLNGEGVPFPSGRNRAPQSGAKPYMR